MRPAHTTATEREAATRLHGEFVGFMIERSRRPSWVFPNLERMSLPRSHVVIVMLRAGPRFARPHSTRSAGPRAFFGATFAGDCENTSSGLSFRTFSPGIGILTRLRLSAGIDSSSNMSGADLGHEDWLKADSEWPHRQDIRGLAA